MGKLDTGKVALSFGALLWLAGAAQGADGFEQQFERIKKTASKQQLFALLYDLPKGGDLHHHSGLANRAQDWYAAATDPKRLHGNEYFTLTKFQNCADDPDQPLRFLTIQRSSYRKLSECRKTEFEPLAGLSPNQKRAWISAMILDRAGEGRNEFFEVIVKRLDELMRDPYVSTDLLAENLKRYAAEGLRYVEPQAGAGNFQDQDGNPISAQDGVKFFRDRLSQPDMQSTGMTMRLLVTILRFTPNAEENLKRAYAFVDSNRDLWVGINMAGREDNDKGYALRFLDTFREMRRRYSGIQLSIHAGEKDSPGHEVRDTLLLGATRIGHGVNLITDADTMLLMRNQKALVEINLISNQLLEYMPDLKKHPFPEYLRTGIPVCLNTDDPGVWDSDIVDEYYTAVTYFNLSWREVEELGRNSLRYSFAPEDVKQKMLRDYEEAIGRFEQRYGRADWTSVLKTVKPSVSGYAGRKFGLAF